MISWYSEETIARLRRLLDVYRRHTGMSLDALAANLGAGEAGPSASTLGRFLNAHEGGPGTELSLRHMREILERLEHLLTSHIPNGAIFLKACAEDLAFFELDPDGTGRADVATASAQLVPAGPVSAEDRAVADRLDGAFLIVRAFEQSRFILSIAHFTAGTGPGNAPSCTVRRVVRAPRPVLMPCEVNVLNRLIYLRGLNPMNQTLRSMCFAPADLDCETLIGFLSGFESPGVSFCARCMLVRLRPEQDADRLIEELSEVNDAGATRATLAELATNADGVVGLFETMQSEAYSRIEPAYV